MTQAHATLPLVRPWLTDVEARAAYDVVMSVDVDGNSSTDAEATFGMLNSQRVIPVTDVPRPPVPESLELMSVSPNPFRHILGVQLQLPRAERVKLVLCDVSGRRVRTLVDGQLEAGRSLRMVEAAGLHSGVYFLRLELDGQVRTRRVVLLKD